MRILLASKRPPYPFFLGGAAKCAYQLLLNLSNSYGVECEAVGSSDYSVTPWSFPEEASFNSLGIKQISRSESDRVIDLGYPVRVFPDFPGSLKAHVRRFKPDIIWTQLEGEQDILEIARKEKIRSILYIHDAEFNEKKLKALAATNCQVVCCSSFLADKVSRVIGRPSYTVYPASELYFGTRGDETSYVTMINPVGVKGVETFFEIAGRMPWVSFLLLESWKLQDVALKELHEKLRELPNVRFQRRVSDMREIYRQTKLLLVPSRWQEGFGMVVIEAQSCGIPVIASHRGGLPESVGNGGILINDYLNPNVWVRNIETVMSDKNKYRELSKKAIAHASSPAFRPLDLAGRFLEICSKEPSKMSGVKLQVRSVLTRLKNIWDSKR